MTPGTTSQPKEIVMSLFRRPSEEYRQARAALDANQAWEKKNGIREETPTYARLNRAVNAALAKDRRR